MPDASDVFLSYSRADAKAVEALRARLSEAGIDSFLDRTRLPAGQPWQPFLERELGRSGAVAVLLGQRIGSWQHREVQLALDRQAREPDLPVIPILLPGLDDEPKGFLSLQTWIDLRADPDDPTQLQNLIAAIHRQPPEGAAAIKAAICPYRGLLPFREEDAAFFFGRDDWTRDLAAKAQAHPLVAVVGRSGSGKSSLVYAGLFPVLRRSPGGTTWDMLAVRPGREPLNALAATLSPPPEHATPAERIECVNADADRLRHGTVRLDQLVRDHLDRQPGTDRLLLYVDQWEELYTLADRTTDGAAADVARFVDLLLAATAERDSPLTVVLTVRADFYDHLLRHPTLPMAIQGQQLNLGPMTRAQLRRCVEGPAAAVGLRFEDNLVDSILDEVGEDEGKLPLLEYALRETWEAARNGWRNGGTPGVLTFMAYNAVGRVAGAIGARAEQIYERLDPARQQAARRLFVSLVAPGEGQEDTRARAAVPDEPAMAEVVRQFSDPAARLLVTGWDQGRGERLAEVSHEALIRSWGTLREWIEANREVLRTRERVRSQLRHWEERGRDPDYLLPPGRPLEEGRELVQKRGDVLVDQEVRDYVELSAQRDHERKAEDQRRRVQIEAAQAVAAANKRTARLTAIGSIVAVALAVLSASLWYNAEVQRSLAETQAQNARKARLVAQTLEARLMAALAQNETSSGNAVNGMLLALRVLPNKGDDEPRPLVDETRQALFAAALAQRELALFRGHEGPVSAVGFSPDGTQFVSGSGDNTLRLWDAASGQELMVLRGHRESVNVAAFSPDGGRIISGSSDHTLRIWNAESGEELLVLVTDGPIYAADFSPDGARIASGSIDGTLRLWASESGDEIGVLRQNQRTDRWSPGAYGGAVHLTGLAFGPGHAGTINTLGFSPDGTRIVSGSQDGTLRVWDVGTGEERLMLRSQNGSVDAAGFSPDGRRIISGSSDHTLRVWNAESGEELLVLRGHTGAVTAAEFSPDGTLLVSASADDTIRIWDAQSGKELQVLRGHDGAVMAVDLSPDGTRIVSGSNDETVRLWDAAIGDESLVLRGHEGEVWGAGFSPDGARIVSGSWDGTTRVWDATSGEELLTLRGHDAEVLIARFSPDGARIVSASADATVRLWDAASGESLLVLRGHDQPVLAAAFSPDGMQIVSGSDDKTLQLWDVASGEKLMTLRGHGRGVWAAGFSPDGARIVSGSGDGTVRVWSATSGEELMVLRLDERPVNAAGFSPDGGRIVSGLADGTLRVWDASSGEELLVMRSSGGSVLAVDFSPDGRQIVSGSDDNTLRVWDADRGHEIAVLRGHEDTVFAAGFSPDGSRIVSGSADNTLRVWSIGKVDADLVTRACKALPRDLSPAAIERFNLDPATPWPCAERARTLWPHPVDVAIPPAAGPATGDAASAAH